MPWYVLDVMHGPGHQSGNHGKKKTQADYHWAKVRLSKLERQQFFSDLTVDMEWPIGSLNLVRNLPPDIREALIERYRWRLDEARRMLVELGAIKTSSAR